ncbi:MAG: hypothetical protein M3370_06255 [Actinomycetota bacterium]|nr:hypothetical protein [Actinomycetota bacterium]
MFHSARPLSSVTVWALALVLAACGGTGDGDTSEGSGQDRQAQACASAREELQAEAPIPGTAQVRERLDQAVEACTQAEPDAEGQTLTDELRTQVAADAEVCAEARQKAVAAADAQDRARFEELAQAAVDTCVDRREQLGAEGRQVFDQAEADARARIERELEELPEAPEAPEAPSAPDAPPAPDAPEAPGRTR